MALLVCRKRSTPSPCNVGVPGGHSLPRLPWHFVEDFKTDEQHLTLPLLTGFGPPTAFGQEPGGKDVRDWRRSDTQKQAELSSNGWSEPKEGEGQGRSGDFVFHLLPSHAHPFFQGQVTHTQTENRVW